MANIRITPEGLEAQAKDLRGKNQEHEQIYAKMKQLVNSLTSEWEGEAQKAFAASFANRETFFKQFSEEIENFAKFMDRAAQTMRETEEQLKSQAQQLS